MLILRIEIAKKVYYNVNLGESYVKVSDIESCDPDFTLGEDFHDTLTTIWNKSDDFVPNTVIFKKGRVNLDNYIDFTEIFDGITCPDIIRCWIMNDQGDTIESITVKNICESTEDETDCYESFTME
jgi:hypothetical protein